MNYHSYNIHMNRINFQTNLNIYKQIAIDNGYKIPAIDSKEHMF